MQYGNPPPGGPGYPYPPPGQNPWGPQGGGPGGGPPWMPQGPTCPRCHGPNVRKASWTWWGGFLGPKIINHWTCGNCSYGFNGRTGQSNTSAIAIYMVVTIVIAFALLGFIVALRFR